MKSIYFTNILSLEGSILGYKSSFEVRFSCSNQVWFGTSSTWKLSLRNSIYISTLKYSICICKTFTLKRFSQVLEYKAQTQWQMNPKIQPIVTTAHSPNTHISWFWNSNWFLEVQPSQFFFFFLDTYRHCWSFSTTVRCSQILSLHLHFFFFFFFFFFSLFLSFFLSFYVFAVSTFWVFWSLLFFCKWDDECELLVFSITVSY